MEFFEDKFPRTVIGLYFLLNIIFFILCNFTSILSTDKWDTYIQTIIEFFNHNNSILITIASILVGIFFTVFSILGSLNINSTFAMISRDNFLKLIKFVLYAFMASIIFVFLMLIVYALPESLLVYYLIILIMPLLIYIFCSSFRLGIFLFLLYKKEIDSLHNKLMKEEQKEDELEDVIQRLNTFLNDYEEEKEKKYLKEEK